MSSIHYFQRYNQRENVSTNNTLLLFSRLYNHSPSKFKSFINELLNYDLEAGIEFNQQQQSKKSVPDGSISQKGFKIVIETKLTDRFDLAQLQNHLNSFETEDFQVLLSLSPKKPNSKFTDEINKVINEFNYKMKKNIVFISTSFKEIVETLNNNLENYDFELQNILNDYEDYCYNDNLINNNESRIRLVTCGASGDENLKFDIYFAPSERGYSEHNYIGLYSNKRIFAIGEISNIIEADLQKDNTLKIISNLKEVTPEEEERIINIIHSVEKNKNWNIKQKHNFFCVNKFHKTDFVKKTKYALQGTKFFDIKELIKTDKVLRIEEIAEELNKITW